MGLGTPPPLEDIAAAVRDRSWLDLRALDVGQLQRVCPLNITVWPDRDDVLFQQEYLHEGGRDTRELTIDAEDIMWCRPTILEVEDVIPPFLPEPDERMSDEQIARLIIDTVTFAEDISEERLKGSNDAYHRKLCIRLMWELTLLPQFNIPQFFGYNSGGMAPHALDHTEAKFADRVRELWNLMQIRAGHAITPTDRKRLWRGKVRRKSLLV